MPIPTTTISGTVVRPDSAHVTSGRVRFRLSQPMKVGGYVVPEEIYAEIANDNTINVDLVPNDAGDVSTTYQVDVIHREVHGAYEREVEVRLGTGFVATAANLNLHDIVVADPPPPADATAYLAAASAHAAAAAASAAAAATATSAAAVSAADAESAALRAEDASTRIGVWVSNAPSILTDTDLTYTSGAVYEVTVGDVVSTKEDGYLYEVQPLGTTDFDLSTTSGVLLKVMPVAGAIHLEAFAPPTTGDAAPVVKKWLERGFSTRSSRMIARSSLTLETRVEAEFPSSGSGYPVHRPVIDCAGAVFQVAASNTTGGIKITKHNNAQQLVIRDLEIQSLAPKGAPGDPTNGLGLHLYSALQPGNPGFGTTQQSELLLDNVRVVFPNASTLGRWDGGILIDGFWWPTMQNCHAVTNHPSNKTTKNFEAGHGIEIVNCYSPFIRGCQALGRFVHSIYLHENTGMAWEDFYVEGCYGVGGEIGLVIASESPSLTSLALKEPGGGVVGGHFNGQRQSIRVSNRRQFTIIGPNLYTTLDPSHATYEDAAGICLEDCHDAIVTVMMSEGGHYVNALDATSGIRLEGSTDNINMVNNVLCAEGIGVNNQSTGTRNKLSGTQFYSANGSNPTLKILDSATRLKGEDAYQNRTPSISFGGASADLTYGSRDAGLTRAGRMIHFWLDLSVTAKGTSTGAAKISAGFPAPVANSDFTATVNYSSGVSAQVMGRISPAGEIALFKVGASGQVASALTHADLSGAFTLKISGSYLSQW